MCLTERAVRKQHSGRSRAYWRRSWTVSLEVNYVVCTLSVRVCANKNGGVEEVCGGRERERERERERGERVIASALIKHKFTVTMTSTGCGTPGIFR